MVHKCAYAVRGLNKGKGLETRKAHVIETARFFKSPLVLLVSYVNFIWFIILTSYSCLCSYNLTVSS